MILFPPAKINLGLSVLRKREDGFHEIETCMIPIPLTDVLEILPSDDFKFHQTGLTINGSPNSNLCVKAFQLMRKLYNIPNVYIHLLKVIPMGAGLGGGSSDAAYVIKGLNELFELKLSKIKMEEHASELGSDCPFFISNDAQIARGRGEKLSPIDFSLKGKFLKIINPEIHIGTAEAYSNVSFDSERNKIEEIISLPIREWKEKLKNDFEASIFPLHTTIEKVKESLYAEGAIYSSMSGSGSTVFGLFENEPVSSSQYDFTRIVVL